MIKYGGPRLTTGITCLFNKILNTGQVSDEKCYHSIVQEGLKFNPNNYRLATLLCSTGKLLTKILSTKIAVNIDICKN